MKRRLGAGLALSMACAGCAGDEIPPLDRALADEIAAAYGGGTGSPTASSTAGSSGRVGSGAVGAVGGATGGGTMLGVVGAAGAAPSVSAAGGSQASPPAPTVPPPPAEPPCDGFAILETNCATGGCHGQGSNLETFAASEAAARSYLGKNGTLACAGAGLLLDPNDPPQSLMVQKLGDSAPCGNPMPLYGELLPKADVACIEEWIGSLD